VGIEALNDFFVLYPALLRPDFIVAVEGVLFNRVNEAFSAGLV
jgi:hypothetical protein